MGTSFKAGSLTLGFVSAILFLNACSGGSGAMGAKIVTRNGTSTDSGSDNVEPETKPGSKPASKPGTDYGSEVLPTGPDTTVPAPKDGDDAVTIPGNITGAFLFCFRDKVDKNKATVYCATEDSVTKKPFEPSERFSPYKFDNSLVDGLLITKRDLPIVHRYHAEFTLTAASPESLTQLMGAVSYKFSGIDFEDRAINFDTRVTNSTRPDIWVQSLKPQNNMGFRCLDRYRMQAAQPYQVVTTPCGSNDIKHDWYITPDGKIAHVNGECLAFDPTDRLTVVKPCDSAESPKFEFNGEQIKIQNSNNCLGLIRPDNSGVDYSAAVACNTGDVTQRWRISEQASP